MANNLSQAPLMAKANLSQLVIIDVQSKLALTMVPEAMQALIKNSTMLVTAAKLLEVPVLITEQYAKGLGHGVIRVVSHKRNS